MRSLRLVALAALFICWWPNTAGAARQSFAVTQGPVRLVPASTPPISVRGLHRYFGTLIVDARSDGLLLVNRLPLERYLLGLNEVPTTWPSEALKAQAVAARTYVARSLAAPRAGLAEVYGFDICASVECQVFSGADVVLGTGGHAWRDAVAATRGETLTYQGGVILSRYHSTSGGTTLNNEWVFVGEPGYPYLTAVPSPYEEASPLYRWRAAFPLKRLQRMLAAAGVWPAVSGRLTAAMTVRSATGLHYPDVVLQGTRGSLRMTADELRDVLRETAPQMYPDEYPSAALTASGRLPETMPSNRYLMTTRGRTAYVVGRGWGHGVGMSQWGAFGMAQRGFDYRAILAHYYRGTSPATGAEPDLVDVGLAWGRDNLQVYGEFRMVDAEGRTLVDDALGDWTFFPVDGELRVEPPPGYRLPLTVAFTDQPDETGRGSRVSLDFVLSKPARVSVESDPPSQSRPRLFPAGRGTVEWRPPPGSGRYQVWLVARAGDAVRRSRPLSIDLGPGVSVHRRGVAGPSTWTRIAVAVGAVAALVAAVTIGLWVKQPRSKIR